MKRHNPHAAASGKKGGEARASRLSPEERSKASKKAAEERWKPKDTETMTIPAEKDQEIKHDNLRFENPSFAASKLITDCPPTTVIPELIRNCIEAASQLKPAGAIQCFKENIHGTPKLGFFNEGPGMSRSDLERLTNLSSSSGKLGFGIRHHYGQGGKISALSASPCGVRYRSCKNGMVSQVFLFMEYEIEEGFSVAKRKRYEVGGDYWEPSRDITNEYKNKKDRPLNKDWTEVLLYGRHKDHDTVSSLLYDRSPQAWIMQGINQHFYVMPDGIEIKRALLPRYSDNSDNSTNRGENRSAHGLLHLTENWKAWKEEVRAEDSVYGKILIKYFLLKVDNKKANGREGSRQSTMNSNGLGGGQHVCIVHNSAIYEMTQPWGLTAFPFGMYAGSSDIAVHIILPDDAPITTDTYRKSLLNKKSGHERENKSIRIEEFASIVKARRPQHLIDYIEKKYRETSKEIDVTEALKRYMKELRESWEKTYKNHKKTQGDPDSSRGPKSQDDPFPPKTANDKNHTGSSFTGPPIVAFDGDPAILKLIGSRAGMFIKDRHTLYLNEGNKRYVEMREQYMQELGIGEDSTERGKYGDVFKQYYAEEAGYLVINAWFYRGDRDWTGEDFENAINKEAITSALASPQIKKRALVRARHHYPRAKESTSKS